MLWTRVIAYTLPSGPTVKGDAKPEVSVKDFTEALGKVDAELKKAGIEDAPDVGRLFVSPLFTFQGTPPWGFDDMCEVVEGLIAASKKHPDVLIVAGSILWQLPARKTVAADPPKPRPFAKAENLAHHELPSVFNTTPVLLGGKVAHLVHWRFTDAAAKLDPPAEFFGAGPGASSWDQAAFWKKWKEGNDSLSVRDKDGKPCAPTVANVLDWGEELVGLELWSDHGDACLAKQAKTRVGLQIALPYGGEVNDKAFSLDVPGALVLVDGSKADKKWQHERGLVVVRAAETPGGAGFTCTPDPRDKKALYATEGKVLAPKEAGALVIQESLVLVGFDEKERGKRLLSGDKPLSALFSDPPPPKDDSKTEIRYERMNDAGKYYKDFHDFLVANYPDFANRPERERECEELWNLMVLTLTATDAKTQKEHARELLGEKLPAYGLKPANREVAKVFWSGDRGKQMALVRAVESRGTVDALESCDIGKFLDHLNDGVFSDPKARAGVIWDTISDFFAQGTIGEGAGQKVPGEPAGKGDIHVYMEHGLTKGSVFIDKELPQMRELQRHGIIRDIRVHIFDKKKGEWNCELSMDSKNLKLMCDKFRAKEVWIEEEGKKKERKVFVPNKFWKPFDLKHLRRVFDKLRDIRFDHPERGGLEGAMVLPKFCAVNGVFANPSREIGGAVVTIFEYDTVKECKIIFAQMSVGEMWNVLAFMDDFLLHNFTYVQNLPDEIRYIDDAIVYTQDSGLPIVQAIREVSDKSQDLYTEFMLSAQEAMAKKRAEWADPEWRKKNNVKTDKTLATDVPSADATKDEPPEAPDYDENKFKLPEKTDENWKPKVWSKPPYVSDVVATILNLDKTYKRGVTRGALETLVLMPKTMKPDEMVESRGKIATLRELLKPPGASG